jgi:hypothetical protein
MTGELRGHAGTAVAGIEKILVRLAKHDLNNQLFAKNTTTNN